MYVLEAIAITLFLLSALVLAWFAGMKSVQRQGGSNRKFQPDYFVGLNFLLNDEPDDAVDIFINALEVNAGTLETHIALTTLLRRRGKVDQAISHLQGLLSSQSFTVRELSAIKVQLARCYIAAGLFDRAERMIDELREASGKVREQSLRLALTLFQTEKEWQKAILAGETLLTLPDIEARERVKLQVSHFYCELAELSLKAEQPQDAIEYLHKGEAVDDGNVRVCLLLATALSLLPDLDKTGIYLRKVLNVNASLLLEIFPGGEKVLLKYPALITEITHEILTHQKVINVRQAEQLAKLIRTLHGREKEIDFLTGLARQQPGPGIALNLLEVAANDNEKLPALVHQAISILDESQQELPQFQCKSCGFLLKSMHWNCPGCGAWSTISPVDMSIS